MNNWKPVLIVFMICATITLVAGPWSTSVSQQGPESGETDGTTKEEKKVKHLVELVSVNRIGISTGRYFERNGDYKAETILEKVMNQGWSIHEIIPGEGEEPAVLILHKTAPVKKK